MEYIFRKTSDGKVAVHDSFVDAERPTGHLIPVEDEETGRGHGFLIEGDVTEHFFATPEEAAMFLRGTALRLDN